MTQINGRRFVCAGVTANTINLVDVDAVTTVNGTGYTAYSSGGTVARVYTLTTTYASADIFALKMTQSADTLYITHPSYPPRKMTRTAHAAWTIGTIDFLDGPYLNVNATATTLTLSGTTGAGITVTASAVTGINGGSGFLDHRRWPPHPVEGSGRKLDLAADHRARQTHARHGDDPRGGRLGDDRHGELAPGRVE
jgi:hypothetical protein